MSMLQLRLQGQGFFSLYKILKEHLVFTVGVTFLIGQLPAFLTWGPVTHLSKHHMTHLPRGSRLTFSCVCASVHACVCLFVHVLHFYSQDNGHFTKHASI